jgi:pimeloyl-ACP methyl ester carboxylesterase
VAASQRETIGDRWSLYHKGMSTSSATVILVHGAWHGGWCWQRLTPHLAARGIAFRTVDLPSVGARPGEAIDLSADAAAVRATLAGISGRAILCGHSYGGMVISLAAAGESRIEHLFYLCAYMPESGESLTSIRGGKRAPWVRNLDGGLTFPDPDRAPAVFYGDCNPADQQWAVRQLRPQASAAFDERVPTPAWKSIPSTYVICTNDMAILPTSQRGMFAPRATNVVELDSGHSPFISKPAELADVFAAAR